MALVEKFEDIKAWQEARKLTRCIYQMSTMGSFSKDYGLRDQICRAAVSSMANIAEGFDCESKVEFARFLAIARRSAVEVQSLLYVALDNNYISKESFDSHYDQATKTKRLIGGFKHSLARK